jgi:hypothetical protein
MEEKAEKVKKVKKAERGRETLFRVSHNHQSKLVQIADYKANMIISVSTMVISAIVAIISYGTIADKIGDIGVLFMAPVIIIVLSSLVSLVFAIQAARPKLIKNKRPAVTGNKTSLLFFGAMSSYSQAEFIEEMHDLLNKGDELYDHLTIDIYNQGLILKRKFNLLVYAYLILMIGFVASVLLFLTLFIFEI